MQITAIILAGGKSKRMGTDKALLEINGVSLLESCIQLCREFADEIIISSNFDEHANFGLPVVKDEVADCGPLGGIVSCLKKSNTNWNFVISVDTPFVNFRFVEFLIAETGEFDAVVPYSNKGKEPLIALYNKSCLPILKEKLENRDLKLHNLFQAINIKFVDSQNWVEKVPKLFLNLNRPQDL